jgi:hypothetical protein
VAYNWVYGDVSLPWEWTSAYKLRNALYPAFLAGPLFVLKETGLDSALVVRHQPYVTHSILVMVNDYFIWKIAKRMTDKDTARYSMLFIIFNRF